MSVKLGAFAHTHVHPQHQLRLRFALHITPVRVHNLIVCNRTTGLAVIEQITYSLPINMCGSAAKIKLYMPPRAAASAAIMCGVSAARTQTAGGRTDGRTVQCI